MSRSEASSDVNPQALYMCSKNLLEICLLFNTQSYGDFQVFKWDSWPLGLFSSFVLEGQMLPWGSFQCFKAFLCPEGSSLACLTKLHGYPTVMSLMVGIFKAWRYDVSDGSHKCTKY